MPNNRLALKLAALCRLKSGALSPSLNLRLSGAAAAESRPTFSYLSARFWLNFVLNSAFCSLQKLTKKCVEIGGKAV